MALNNKATEFSNRLPSFELISEAELERLQSLRSEARVEANKVDVAALGASEPGFGNTFQKKFIKGLELCIQGNGQLDVVKGQLLLKFFGNELAAFKAKGRTNARY